MSIGLQGRRVPTVGDVEKPGDYCLLTSGALRVLLPSGVPGRLDPERWAITVHEDDTVTVHPSIHDAPDGWHGWLVHGVWTSV